MSGSWMEIAYRLYLESSMLNTVKLSHDDDDGKYVPILPLLSASLISKLITLGHQRLLFVFPELEATAVELALILALSAIVSGESRDKYDIYGFKPGQMLKLGKAHFIFKGFEIVEGEEKYILQMSDLKIKARPAEAPFFQKSSAQNPTSDKIYQQEKRLALESASDEFIIRMATGYRSHLLKTLYFVGEKSTTQQQLFNLKVNEASVENILLLGEVTKEGKTQLSVPGQISGIPAITIASDVVNCIVAIRTGSPANLVLYDATSTTKNNRQMYFLDQLTDSNTPVVALVDSIGAFDIGLFREKGYLIWDWCDRYLDTGFPITHKLKHDIMAENRRNLSIEVVKCEDKHVGLVLNKALELKESLSGVSVGVDDLLDSLLIAVFTTIRQCMTISTAQRSAIQPLIQNIVDKLLSEHYYLSDEDEIQIAKTMETINSMLSIGMASEKVLKLIEKFDAFNGKRINIVLPEQSRIAPIEAQSFWHGVSQESGYLIDFTVSTVSAFMKSEPTEHDIVVLFGWLNKSVMQQILFSNINSQYCLLLYPFEIDWYNNFLTTWNRELTNDNEAILSKIEADYTELDKAYLDKAFPFVSDDATSIIRESIDAIEELVQESTYRHLGATKERVDGSQVEVIPIEFYGDKLGLYRPKYKLITIADLFQSSEDSVSNRNPDEINSGDLVAVRDSGRDLIRDQADSLMGNDMSSFRGASELWKTSISFLTDTVGVDEAVRRIKLNGCPRGDQTIKNWFLDEDMICPDAVDDVINIGIVANDENLVNHAEEVIEAARKVRAYHTRAGKLLGDKLKDSLLSKLIDENNVGTGDIWNPIELHLDGIGNVTIMKVLTIGEKRYTDAQKANRVISRG